MTNIILNEYENIKNIWNSDLYPNEFYSYNLVFNFTRYLFELYDSIDDIKEKIFDKFKNYNLSPDIYEEYKADITILQCYKGLCNGNIQHLKHYEYIPIYQSDIDNINKCENQRQKKFLFTLYVLARYTDKHGWVNIPENDLYKLANISKESKKKSNIIYELKQLNLIKTPLRVDNTSIGVETVNNGNEVLKIYNIKHLGNQYIEFIDDKRKCCENCGKLIKIKSKFDYSTKYCKRCAEEIESSNAVIRKRRQRNK